MTPIRRREVQARFDAYPADVRPHLWALRELVLETARQTPRTGDIDETLKWGEPAYVTVNKAGSTVRIDWKAKAPQQVAVYFNCQTDLVERFRMMFPNDFQFDGNRALVLPLSGVLPADALSLCIAASFTYHLDRHAHRHADRLPHA